MTANKFFDIYFDSINKAIQSLDYSLLDKISILIKSCKDRGRKLIIVGNGGSAAISSHVAVDFTKAAKIRAINFNEADLITCFANDFGHDYWMQEALNMYSDNNDIVVLISSSGKSKNVINAAKWCVKFNLKLNIFDLEPVRPTL